jgi:hypothetical protein
LRLSFIISISCGRCVSATGEILDARASTGFDRCPVFRLRGSGLLVQDGVYRLEDPAPVPEWRTPGDPRAKIRIVDLLQMSSGLRFMTRSKWWIRFLPFALYFPKKELTNE